MRNGDGGAGAGTESNRAIRYKATARAERTLWIDEKGSSVVV